MQKNIFLQVNLHEDEVEITLKDAIEKLNNAIASRNLAQSLLLAMQIIKKQPDCLPAYHALFNILTFQKKHSEILKFALQAIEYFPGDALSFYKSSCSYRFLRQPELALNALKKAVTLAPKNVFWCDELGIMYKENGEFELAKTCFKNCIEMQVQYIPAYSHLAELQEKLSDDNLSYLTHFMKTTLPINTRESQTKVFAAYSLFKHFEHQKDFKQAFNYLLSAAKIQRKLFNYDHNKEIKEHAEIATVFNKNFFAKSKLDNIYGSVNSSNSKANSPIFICGLPRSGTTLVEQIISSHDEVIAGDELFELANATQSILQNVKPKLRFPFWANELKDKHWQGIGQEYLTLTQHINTKNYFTDKMLLNYKAIGLMALSLPEAKIVFCQRPPMDLLLGCFKQHFGQGNRYTYDLEELTEMIIAQHQLMCHWQSVLPNKIFILNYQNLVDEQQKTTESLLKYLELPWQNSCIEFHKNQRAIHTISNVQVRQPLFNTSLNSWKNYYLQLKPYADKMQQAGLVI